MNIQQWDLPSSGFLVPLVPAPFVLCSVSGTVAMLNFIPVEHVVGGIPCFPHRMRVLIEG